MEPMLSTVRRELACGSRNGDLQLQLAATIDRMAARTLPDVIDDLQRRGLRMTPQRRAIVAEVMKTRGHISPTALARKVQGDMPGVNASTIYRTLAVLEEAGVLAHAHLEGGAEYHRAEEAGHVHLTCSRCGAEDDLSLGEAEASRVRAGSHALRDLGPLRKMSARAFGPIGLSRRGVSVSR